MIKNPSGVSLVNGIDLICGAGQSDFEKKADNMKRFILWIALVAFGSSAWADEAQMPRPEDVASPDAIVAALYDVISGPAGDRDWARGQSLFVSDGRLIPTGTTMEGGYTAWSWQDYAKLAGDYFKENPFYEVELSHTQQRFGNIIHRFSTYESRKDPKEEPFSRGINSIQLLFHNDRWWIVTVYWQSESEETPIPNAYLP